FSGSGVMSDIECSTARLLPGQIANCTASYGVTQADIDAGEVTNVATAGGTPPGLLAAVRSDPSRVTVPFIGESALLLTKKGEAVDVDGNGVVTAGDSIRWSFTATNAGVSTLTTLRIVDPMVDGVTCEATL